MREAVYYVFAGYLPEKQAQINASDADVKQEIASLVWELADKGVLQPNGSG